MHLEKFSHTEHRGKITTVDTSSNITARVGREVVCALSQGIIPIYRLKFHALIILC